MNIILKNNQLNISSGESTFTIGQLNGNTGSSVLSTPNLIIATDTGVNGVFAGNIQGASSLLKTGPGAQTLSGANAFTGGATVGEGTLILTGSLATTLTVDAPAILMGTGSVGQNVTNYGTISPGQSIGTIRFLAGFTNTNGNYDVEVNGAGDSDLISVIGDALINGGTVYASSVDGTYSFHHPYTIVEAANVSGKYSGVTLTINNPLIIPELTYDLQHVYLTLLTDIASAAETSNQIAVANQLDSITDPTTEQSLVLSTLVDLSPSEIQAALDDLGGFQHTFDAITTIMINRQFIRRLYDPLRSIVTTVPDCCCAPRCDDFTVWLESGGTFTHINKNQYTTHFKSDGYEITGGIQKTFCSDWTLGVAGSYENDQFHFTEHAGNGNSSTWLVGLYGLYRPSIFYGLVDFAFGQSNNSLYRHIHVGDLYYKAHSKPKISQFTFYGEVGVDLPWKTILLQPFFGVEAGAYRRNHITEYQPEGFGLSVHSKDFNQTSIRLGVHLTADICDVVDISLDVAWDRYLSGNHNSITDEFESFGTADRIKGVDLNVNSVDYALTLSTLLCDRWRLYVEGSGETWSNANQYNVLGGFTFSW